VINKSFKIQKDFKIEDQGMLNDYLGDKPTARTTPALSTVILSIHEEDEDFNNKAFDYRQVVKKASVLQEVYQTRHCMCSAPVCQVFHSTQSQACRSSKMNWQIPSRRKGQRTHHQPKGGIF
jgi:hypothetical protein